MKITFPGGVAVDATQNGLTVHTDQPPYAGGGGTAMAPFDVFLASIGTCAGFYALRFCQERGIDTTGLALELITEKDSERKRIATVTLELTLPPAFPAKYTEPIKRAMDQCAVKRHIVEPPAFEIRIGRPELVAS